MSEEFLDRPNVIPLFEQMSRQRTASESHASRSTRGLFSVDGATTEDACVPVDTENRTSFFALGAVLIAKEILSLPASRLSEGPHLRLSSTTTCRRNLQGRCEVLPGMSIAGGDGCTPAM